MDLIEIQNRFRFHPATDITGPMHSDVRGMCLDLAIKLDSFLPDSREKSLVFTKLEEVMFWSNAAIARNS